MRHQYSRWVNAAPSTDAGSGPDSAREALPEPWKVLVADADPEFQRLAGESLAACRFAGRGVRVLSVSSAEEAQALLRAEADVAVALIDAALGSALGGVPGDGKAGLALVDRIRSGFGNQRIRLLVHAGAAGNGAETDWDVVEAHDVSDYHARAELTRERLRAVVVTGLRAYDNLRSLATSRKGLARMMLATGGLLSLKTPEQLYGSLLPRLAGLLGTSTDGLLCVRADATAAGSGFAVKAGKGRFAGIAGLALDGVADARAQAALARLGDSSETILETGYCALRLHTQGGASGMIYLEGQYGGSSHDWQLVELFRNKASIALENAILFEELQASQKATVMALAQLAQYKEKNTEGHFRRIERMVKETAQELKARGHYVAELDDDLIEKIGQAAILLDVGMVSVSDETLGGPGELLEDDRAQIALHTEVGHRILANAAKPLRGRSLLAVAAEIAHYHHERFDGSGYPKALQGTGIPLVARIAACADVFEALTTDRHYRKAWPVERAIAWMTDRAGQDFDPLVVEAFVAVIRRITAVEPGFIPVRHREPAAAEPAGFVARGISTVLNRFRPHH